MTSCSVWHFFIGTFFGITPGTFTFIYVGINLQNLTEVVRGKRALTTVEILFFVTASMAITGSIYIITRESKKALQKILNESNIDINQHEPTTEMEMT